MTSISQATAIGLGLAISIAFSAVAFAAEIARPSDPATSAEIAAVNGGETPAPRPNITVESCLADWLSQQKMADGTPLHVGTNGKPDDPSLKFIATSAIPVKAARGSPAWVASHNAAYTEADLQARASLAREMGTFMQSSRSGEMFKSGGNQLPPDLEQASAALSNADKLNKLTGLALDDAIKQFEPNFNGTGMSDEAKRQHAVTTRNTVMGHISADADALATGAFTVLQCEGNDSDGHYAVEVGLLWSTKLANIAASVYDPQIKLPATTPAPTLAQQFAQKSVENPNWMAFTQGARVMTDEYGHYLVVGFGEATGTSVQAADIGQARLRALGAIQQFVGERIVARDVTKDEYADQELANGDAQTFDATQFRSRVNAVARSLVLKGVYEGGSWRGMHPWGNTPMQVIAMVWTPDSAAMADRLTQQVNAATQHTTVGLTPQPTAPATGNTPNAAPVRQGLSGKTSDF